MKIFFLFLMAFSFSASSQAQKVRTRPYHFGFGVGYQPQIKENFFASMKVYSKKGNAVQFNAFNYTDAFRTSAIMLPNFPITKDGNWKLLMGLGGHIGIWKNGLNTNSYRTNPIIGLDGLLGTEVCIPKLHLAFQAQFNPNADLFGNNETFYDWGGFAVHFTF